MMNSLDDSNWFRAVSQICASLVRNSARRLLPLLVCCVLLSSPMRTFADDAAADADSLWMSLEWGGHIGAVWQVAFTPDSNTLISAADDKTVRVWDVATGQLLRVIHLPQVADQFQRIFALAVSPDGRTIAVGGALFPQTPNSGRIFVVSLETGKAIHVHRGHDGVRSLAYSHDGKRLASLGIEGKVMLWSALDGLCERSWEVSKGGFTHGRMCFSPDDKFLLTCKQLAGQQDARIWNVDSGELWKSLTHSETLTGLAWCRDGNTIVTTGTGGTVYTWSAEGTLLSQLRLPERAEAIAVAPDSQNALVTWLSQGQAETAFLNLISGERRSLVGAGRGYSCAVSSDGRWAASGADDGEIAMWRVVDGVLVQRFVGKGQPVRGVEWGEDGQTVLWGNGLVRRPGQWEYPLERAFDLNRLQFVPRNEDSWPRNPVVTLGQGTSVKLRDGRAIEKLGVNIHVSGGTSETRQRIMSGHLGAIHSLAVTHDQRYLVSGSIDQTLCIWSLERETLLLSLFVAGDDWIVWTPEGYCAASAAGEGLIAWQTGRGPESLPDVYPAGRFRRSLYRPDVIQRLLATGSVEKSLALADKDRGETTEVTQIQDVLPPNVEIVRPLSTERTITEDSLLVEAIARSRGKYPVTSMRLLLNGRPYDGQRGMNIVQNPQLGEVTTRWTVQLELGRHEIAVQAESAVSEGVSDPVEVTYNLSRGGVRKLTASPATLELPSLYVLAIGISEYPGSLKLNFAARDAEVLSETLKSTSSDLYRSTEVKLLTDQQATRREILKGLAWLRTQMTQRDVGILMFAGHGAKDSDGNFYFLPVDVDPDDLLSTGVPGDQVTKALSAIPGRIIVLADACHSGAVEGERRRAVGSLTDDLLRDLLTDDVGVVVMCSAMGQEFALESATIQHGFFTYAIVQGLLGKADYNDDGLVHLNELDLYVTERVKALADGRQHPVTARPTSIRSFPLGRVQ